MNQQEYSAQEKTNTGFWSGVRQALPIVLGYIPVGFAYGVLAKKSGLGLFNCVAMSVIVFAGSAQLIGAGLFGAAASPFTLVFTTFVVNLRHLLMSAALAPKLKGWHKWQIALFGYELTDETFALHSMRMANRTPENRNICSKYYRPVILDCRQSDWLYSRGADCRCPSGRVGFCSACHVYCAFGTTGC